ncbi:hypothetical protein HY745_11370, partial [Candidatus Desantisbacteria bacterium]|nr:hypothetical protein [Candidatus Desantisbacteria bacterium]
MVKTKKRNGQLINRILILVFLLMGAIHINRTYAYNLPDARNCSACHASVNGNFAEQSVDLATSCAVCHSSLMTECNNGAVPTDYGMFKTIPPITEGVVLHAKHSGVNLQANNPACEKCHFQVDCSTCHVTHHEVHSSTNPDNSPKELLVTDGNSKHSTNIYCATSPCHATVQNALNTESSVLPIKNSITNNPIKTGDNPKGIAINSNTKRIYVANYNSNTISVIDGDSTNTSSYNKVIATINVGNNPYDVAVNKNYNFIYVTNTNDNTVTIINGDDHSIFGTVSVGQNPRDIEVNEATNEVYVINYGGDSITSFSASGGTVTTISQNIGGIRQRGIAIDETRNKIYIGILSYDPAINSGQYDLTVIDGITKTLAGSILNVGISYSMAINEIVERLYIGSSGKIIVVSTAQGSSGIINNIVLGDTDTIVTGIKVNNNIVYA